MLVLDAFPAISEDFNAHAMGGALRDETKTAARETSCAEVWLYLPVLLLC